MDKGVASITLPWNIPLQTHDSPRASKLLPKRRHLNQRGENSWRTSATLAISTSSVRAGFTEYAITQKNGELCTAIDHRQIAGFPSGDNEFGDDELTQFAQRHSPLQYNPMRNSNEHHIF